MACHTIVEENAIVSSVEFNENSAGGASTVVGQFVGPEMTKAYSSAGRGRRRFYARDSRDTTLNNGRRAIQQVVSQLRLRQAFVDRACRLFRTAVERNFVQGRKTLCVVAVCLYMVCREDNSPHMLIDFSDAVQINVYVLGHAFLKFKQLTGLNLAVIDPSIYIHRFAARLELGSEQEQTTVSQLALRLVASMQRDWIQAGRRPSGICGAALYLSAIYHEKPRTYKDVGRIVRVSPDTIKKRVDEFEKTPISGMMSRDELANMALSEFDISPRMGGGEGGREGAPRLVGEADPPSFTRAVKMKAAEALRKAQALRDEGKDAKGRGESGKEEEEVTSVNGRESSTSSSSSAAATANSSRERGGSVAGARSRKRSRRGGEGEGEEEERGKEDVGPLIREESEGGTEEVGLYKELMDQLLDEEEEQANNRAVAADTERAAAQVGINGRINRGGAAGGGAVVTIAAPVVLGAAAVEEIEEKEDEEVAAVVVAEEEKEEEEEVDDTAQYIRSEEEVEKLSKVWHEVHRGYLEKQARKKAEEEAAKKRAEEDFNYRQPGQSNHQKKKAAAAVAAAAAAASVVGAGGSRAAGGMGGGGPARSPAEIAVSNHLAKKRISKKINYEAVKMLGNDDDMDALPPELEAILTQGRD